MNKLIYMNKKDEIIYLAIPYTWNAMEAFYVANKVAGRLMKEGYIVFSPISHSHPIAEHLGQKIQFSHDFWIRQDLPILRKSDKVIFIVVGDDGMKRIEESKGCQSEKAEAIKCNIPIEYVKFNLNFK